MNNHVPQNILSSSAFVILSLRSLLISVARRGLRNGPGCRGAIQARQVATRCSSVKIRHSEIHPAPNAPFFARIMISDEGEMEKQWRPGKETADEISGLYQKIHCPAMTMSVAARPSSPIPSTGCHSLSVSRVVRSPGPTLWNIIHPCYGQPIFYHVKHTH